MKLRYFEIPMFVEVSSVINQYALETDVSGGVGWGDFRTLSVGAHGKYADRPTITYSPVLGK